MKITLKTLYYKNPPNYYKPRISEEGHVVLRHSPLSFVILATILRSVRGHTIYNILYCDDRKKKNYGQLVEKSHLRSLLSPRNTYIYGTPSKNPVCVSKGNNTNHSYYYSFLWRPNPKDPDHVFHPTTIFIGFVYCIQVLYYLLCFCLMF